MPKFQGITKLLEPMSHAYFYIQQSPLPPPPTHTQLFRVKKKRLRVKQCQVYSWISEYQVHNNKTLKLMVLTVQKVSVRLEYSNI